MIQLLNMASMLHNDELVIKVHLYDQELHKVFYPVYW